MGFFSPKLIEDGYLQEKQLFTWSSNIPVKYMGFFSQIVAAMCIIRRRVSVNYPGRISPFSHLLKILHNFLKKILFVHPFSFMFFHCSKGSLVFYVVLNSFKFHSITYRPIICICGSKGITTPAFRLHGRVVGTRLNTQIWLSSLRINCKANIFLVAECVFMWWICILESSKVLFERV